MQFDLVVVLAITCAVQSAVIALLCASVPFLWWLHLRSAADVAGAVKDAREARQDVAKLDEMVDKLCKAANLS